MWSTTSSLTYPAPPALMPVRDCGDNGRVTSPANSAAVPPGTSATGAFDLAAIGTGLAFAESLGELFSVLRAGGAAGTAVVQAPPGTGKTTLVPPLLANLTGHTREARRVVVTQPRRVAARAAARRLAALDGSRIGDRVG
ncbi:MAG TPA: hypothetical protein VGP44_04085, partial [Gemmatimonadales bacterium]|nr:hypothetical protein [Gemmatimonadales bacterium]